MASNESNIIIYNTLDGRASVALYAHDGSVWMNQAQLAELFDTSIPNMSMHISNVLKENELQADSVIKNYLTTASDGKQYNVTFYSLEMILAVGFRVRSKRGTQFRIWANQHLREYLVKGFTMDDERLKNPNGRPDYFDELLERVREIRASEKRFYQKVRDLLALSSDYDSTDKATQMFFAETQNKLLYAVTGETAAELIVHRADASQPNMALTSWKGSVVRKQDIYTAKNYLQQGEIDTLNRLTTLFLDTAELRVRERKDLTLRYWRETVDGLLNFQGKVVLQGAGSVSNRQMEEYVNAIYEQFNARRKAFAAAEADREEQLELSAATDEDLAALQSSAERREKI
ncbi:MAG: virulence RhuM family protein [Paludibacteraceae bacterium]|nr:virulence RhuM family protein [Paludibacteraceae bacterium]